MFAPVEDLPGQNLQKSFFENILAFAADQFKLGRDTSYHFHKLVIEEWSTNFQTHGHAGTVHFDQNVVWQVGLHVYILNTGKRVIGISLDIVISQDGARVVTIQTVLKIGRKKPNFLGWAEYGHGVEVTSQWVEGQALQPIFCAEYSRKSREVGVNISQRSEDSMAERC